MIRIAAVSLAAALLLWGGFSFFALWGDNYRYVLDEQVVEPDEVAWQVVSGQGRVSEEGLVISRPGRRGRTRIGIQPPWPVSAQDIRRIEIIFSNKVQFHSIAFGWSVRPTALPARWAPAELQSDSVAGVDAAWLRPEKGTISLLAVEMRGGVNGTTVIEEIRLLPSKPGFLRFQQLVFGQWFDFRPWTQSSAHHAKASLQPTLVSPVIALACWALLSIVLWYAFRARSWRSTGLAAVVVVALAWLFLDMRWQAGVLSRATETVAKYSSKSWQEQRASAEDGKLFEFMQRLKRRVDVSGRRLFALGRGEFWRTRARYHGLPASTRSSERPLQSTWVRHLLAGDMLVLLDAPHIDSVEAVMAQELEAGFGIDLDLSDAVGREAFLAEVAGEPAVQLETDGKELVRVERLELPGPGFYRLSMGLKAIGPHAAIRLIVRWEDGHGNRFNATDRQFTVSGEGFEERSVPFVLTRRHPVSLFVVQESGGGVAAREVRIEPLDAKDPVYLRSGERGPFLVVEPILVDALHQAYEVL